MDKLDFEESDPKFGTNEDISRQLIDNSVEQRVATDVSEQLMSDAFESQFTTKPDKSSDDLISKPIDISQPFPVDVSEHQLNQNKEKPAEQIIADRIGHQFGQPLGRFQEEFDEEDEDEDEDSLGIEKHVGMNAKQENIDNNMSSPRTTDFFSKIETQPKHEVLYQLSEDSNILRAHEYGIDSSLRIDNQNDPNTARISVYELNSEDPFQTPERKVVDKGLSDRYADDLSNIRERQFESVSTNFGISSNDEINNLLTFESKNPQLSEMTAISHPNDDFYTNQSSEVNPTESHSQNTSQPEHDFFEYDSNELEDPYVVTSGGEVSSLPTHTFAETVTLNDSITNSTDSQTNRNDIESSPTPILDNFTDQISSELTQTSHLFASQLLEDTVEPTEPELEPIEELVIKSSKVESEAQSVAIVEEIETMAKTKEPESTTAGSEATSCPCGPSVWFSTEHMNPQVAELVYWKNAKNSGIVFGSGLVILLSLTVFSIISVVAYASLAALSVTLSFRIYKNILQAVQKTNEGHPFKEYLEVEITPSNERIHQIVDSILTHVNCTVNKLRSVFLVEDIVDSLKFVVLFWCLTYIGSWFNGLTLIILGYLALFSAPKVYEMNKPLIDQYINLAVTQINDITSKVKAKIPFPAKKEKDN